MISFPRILMGDFLSCAGTIKPVKKNTTVELHTTFTIQDFFGKKQLEKIWHNYSSTTLIPQPCSPPPPTKLKKNSLLKVEVDRQAYLKQCQNLIKDIHSNKLTKAVLATRFDHTYTHSIDPLALYHALPKKNGLPFLYQIGPQEAFLGVTPETLYERHGNVIFSEALAATALNPEELQTDKHQQEFQIVVDDIAHCFSLLCKTYRQSPPQIKQAGALYHLNIQFQGTLKEGVTDDDIIQHLHPTPAMGGYPRKAALKAISNYETIERGFYSSYFGFLSPTYSRIMVAIRCALIKENTLSAFAGGGIVANSVPAIEFEELENKARMWRDLL